MSALPVSGMTEKICGGVPYSAQSSIVDHVQTCARSYARKTGQVTYQFNMGIEISNIDRTIQLEWC